MRPGVRTTEFIDGDRWASLTSVEQEKHRAAWADAMSDPAFVAELRQGLDDLAAGRVHKWSDVKKELAMTDDQAKTPKPGDPEPTPPTEPTEPPLEPAEPEDDGSTQPQGDPA